MASKRRGVHPRRVDRPPSATAEGRFMLLLEDIREQNRATIEAVFAVKNELQRELRELREYLERRIEVLEVAIKHLYTEVTHVKADVERLDKKLDSKADAARLHTVEIRVEGA